MDPQQSYEHHAASFAAEAAGPAVDAASTIWYDSTAIDTWRHARAYEIAEFLKDDGASWITIGDGRFGLDAQRLLMRGIINVLPTDICPDLLEEAKKRGYIKEYRLENAEQLSFQDEHFDYVYIKESYHHFPRPPVAFYEMLRVAKRGLIMVEPFDRLSSPLRSLLTFFRSVVSLKKIHPDMNMYEQKDQNYVYSISIREIEKAALALNFPMIAYKSYTDIYDEKLNQGHVGSANFYKLRTKILFREFLAKLHLDGNTMIQMAIFKISPSEAAQEAMKSSGWTLLTLPRNPYLP